MSAPAVIGFVCEGLSDVIVFQAILDRVFVQGYEPRKLRPGGGLSGSSEVQRWCKHHGPGLEWFLPGMGIDVLIIHIDADARHRLGVATTAALCATIKRWLGVGGKSPRLVIVIPKEATEAWLLAAVGSATPSVEADPSPRDRLISLGELPGRDVPWQVRERHYEELAALLGQQIPELRPLLVELDRFMTKLERLAAKSLSARPSPS